MAAPVVIVLAAGRGERFLASGGLSHKLEARLNGQRVLDHTLAAVTASRLEWHLVRPEGGTAGMGESIALGVMATPEASGWLILPADLPFIQPDTLRAVARALTHTSLVVPHYCYQPGHPVGFDRRYYAALRALRGEAGARSIVQAARRQGAVSDLMLEDEGIVRDIDTLADLQRALEA